jgi:hypothetical protein
MLQIQPQVEEDYARVRAFHRTTYFHYIFGKGMPSLAFEPPPSATLYPGKKVPPGDGISTLLYFVLPHFVLFFLSCSILVYFFLPFIPIVVAHRQRWCPMH